MATATVAEEEADPTPEGEVDDEENLDVPAGETYVGQFIDHDLTLNPEAGNLSGTLDPTTLINQRTPKFDLDSVYGAGPSGSPQLYAADGMHLRLGVALTGADDSAAVDQLRDASGQAVIGDGRNDENRLVASLHTLVMRLHNQEVDRIREASPGLSRANVFAQARQQTLWNYQWAVLTDFLPTIVGQPMVNSVLPSIDVSRGAPNLRFYNPCTMAIPVEFSVAAYRFGHSMVRPSYRINATVPDRLPVFDASMNPNTSLVGFGPSPSSFAVDWNFLLPIDGVVKTGHPQPSYKFDSSLVFPLSLLPLPEAGDGVNNLASRNLLRAEQLGLPSGQAVARAMGITPLADDRILIGKATGDPAEAEAITAVSPRFAGKAPLWNYILSESVAQAYNVSGGQIHGDQLRPFRLGPVGGRIVAEVFVGLLAADRSSVLYQRGFRPDPALTSNGKLGFGQVISATAGENLALGQRVRWSDHPAGAGAAAVDGSTSTGVALRSGDSLAVDLGSQVNLKRVNAIWSGAAPAQVTIEAASRGQGPWRTLWAGNGQQTNLALGQLGTAEFVRVTVSGGSASRTLAELETFRQPRLIAPSTG